MIRKTKNRLLRQIFHRNRDLSPSDIKEARDYIAKFWKHLKRTNTKSKDTLIGLPHAYLVPAHEADSTFSFDEMYYWDSYFMVQGMLSDPKKRDLVVGILDDLLYEVKQFGMIPNANKTYLCSHSQPPLLTSFIFDVYRAYGLDKRWLEQAIKYAKQEYEQVWMASKKPHHHKVHEGLSRYYDVNVLHDLAEAESGWDMTTRFGRKCLDYLPIDLNSYLYKYETDFESAAKLLKKPEEAELWHQKALRRKKTISKLMWNSRRSFFFDYNFVKGTQSQVASLAAYTTMWAGLASKEQAKKLVQNLSRFEMKGGLATTEDPALQLFLPQKTPSQWAYPNGWAPLHFLVIQGLERYGYKKEASRIAHKWLKTNLDWYNYNGVFIEKYNVVDPDKLPAEGLYPNQIGFGWTNAIFERLCQDYIDK